MKTLADVTLEEFTKMAEEEGITNQPRIVDMFNRRPLWAPFVERILRETFQEFKEKLNKEE